MLRTVKLKFMSQEFVLYRFKAKTPKQIYILNGVKLLTSLSKGFSINIRNIVHRFKLVLLFTNEVTYPCRRTCYISSSLYVSRDPVRGFSREDNV